MARSLLDVGAVLRANDAAVVASGSTTPVLVSLPHLALAPWQALVAAGLGRFGIDPRAR